MKAWILLAAALASAATFAQAPPAAQRAVERDLTDAQVVHIVIAASRADVDAGKLARTKGSAAPVKAFAEQMIRDHDGLNAQAAALARKLGLKPEDNPVSRSLRLGARENLGNLRGFTKGAAFDRAYAEHEVAYHAAVLQVIDQLLAPAAGAPELKALIAAARPAFAAHQAEAREVDAALRR